MGAAANDDRAAKLANVSGDESLQTLGGETAGTRAGSIASGKDGRAPRGAGLRLDGTDGRRAVGDGDGRDAAGGRPIPSTAEPGPSAAEAGSTEAGSGTSTSRGAGAPPLQAGTNVAGDPATGESTGVRTGRVGTGGGDVANTGSDSSAGAAASESSRTAGAGAAATSTQQATGAGLEGSAEARSSAKDGRELARAGQADGGGLAGSARGEIAAVQPGEARSGHDGGDGERREHLGSPVRLIDRAGALVAASDGGSAGDVAALELSAPAAQEASAAAAFETPTGPLQMQDVIDSLRATMVLASRQGTAQARIALRPAELGGVRVHLSQTEDGLMARLTADTPAAAAALSAGRGELHQSLSSLGLSLLRLDIGTSAQSSAGHGDARRDAAETGGRSGARTTAAAQVNEQEAPADAAAPVVASVGGGLVDVLA
ncbi:MAG TPA: flagellar hook-length control protein FliK [Solirubrobacteraceae bacterium]|nr:flagellar hook-length control protein FliK [Solirubrobacteraceae bacterium]